MTTWRRLLRAAEVVGLDVPRPPPLSTDPRARHYVASGSQVEGKGLDAREVVELRLHAGIAPGAAGVLAAGDPLGDAPDVLYATSDRTWWAAELPALERKAEAILLRHDFPATLGAEQVAWAWDRVNLSWAEKPAAIAGGAELVAWDGFKLRPVYRESWPEWSPFDWAQRVWVCRRLRLWADCAGRPDVALSAGFELGTFLGLWAGREQYRAMTRRGGQSASWKTPALIEAQRIRKINPRLGQIELEKKLRVTDSVSAYGLPETNQVVKTIRDWEKAGVLQKSSQNSTRPK